LATARAASWVLVPILAGGCAGGSVHRAAEKPARPAPATKVRTVAQPPAASAPVRPRRVPPSRPRPSPRASKPKVQKRLLPWRQDGMSEVAHVRVRRIAVYRSPRARHALLMLGRSDENGTQRTFLVRATKGDWVRVFLPSRPNGSQGWVRRRALRMYTNGYRLVIRLASHQLRLWRGERMLAKYPVAVGTRSTPTPRGLYYIVELLRPSSPNGTYGPFSFGLSAHSNVLKRFAGGDGRVGLHGTNQPGLVGTNVSHGCIRLRNPAVRRLAKILPLGTPVYIRA
jgi:hypothetical protein